MNRLNDPRSQRNWVSMFVPQGFSVTDDFFAGVMVDAPEFPMNGMSVDEAFDKLSLGIDSIIAKTKSTDAIDVLNNCKAELAEIRAMFATNVSGDPEVRNLARKRLVDAYYGMFRKAGQVRRPGSEAGPDDDI